MAGTTCSIACGFGAAMPPKRSKGEVEANKKISSFFKPDEAAAGKKRCVMYAVGVGPANTMGRLF